MIIPFLLDRLAGRNRTNRATNRLTFWVSRMVLGPAKKARLAREHCETLLGQQMQLKRLLRDNVERLHGCAKNAKVRYER
jgi:hypothetical protein